MSSTASANEGEKILIVDDDARLRRLLERFLDEQGYRVRTVENTEQMDRLLSRELFQLVVLDLMMPGEDGLSACQRLRESNNQIPIIMLTAKGDEASRIQGLEQGADDYLAKPFSFDELLARVRSLSRRQSRQRTTLLQHGNIRMDLVSREVTVGEKAVYLTQREYALLEIFLQNIGRVLTRTQIAEKIWDCHFDMETNLIDVYVRKLRAKLGADAAITTVRGVGYSMP